ncbi:hypothetical protein BpHYR1_044184 [Brachionus plicatilis]|uniref:DUF1279 domain-containing protein n=1 Tax=Brachionus plicatilis TaxID=10195 RepID=A0A3M7PAP7_BRAPC|nr:hypothetical protein BpHYR1_044184 [Brachionus plicatilis]
MNRLSVFRVPSLINQFCKTSNSFKLVTQERTLFKNFCKKQVFEIQKKTIYFQPVRCKHQDSTSVVNQTGSVSIFKRFKDAYKQHGKILIACHFVSSWGWIISFFFLAKAGLDITSVLNVLEKLRVMSRETIDSINTKINTFNLENYLKESFVRHIISEHWIKSIGQSITGQTLKFMITAIVLYKIITPLRYVFTVALTKFVIKLFKKQGRIPLQPPPGSSIKELYTEQKQVIGRRLKVHREKYSKKSVFRNRIIKASQSIFNKASRRKMF